ncbi:MAG: hypothetical protein FWE64_04590 [Alphaproteobacteria bacterium]|nr:hypothetical protein [Alphaproteobacteria bacterium]
MMSKIKKYFFTGMFGALYVSFAAQFVYALFVLVGDLAHGFTILGLLSVQWLVLISARYISKRSATPKENSGGGYHGYRR